jgi:hypothetical protein
MSKKQSRSSSTAVEVSLCYISCLYGTSNCWCCWPWSTACALLQCACVVSKALSRVCLINVSKWGAQCQRGLSHISWFLAIAVFEWLVNRSAQRAPFLQKCGLRSSGTERLKSSQFSGFRRRYSRVLNGVSWQLVADAGSEYRPHF